MVAIVLTRRCFFAVVGAIFILLLNLWSVHDISASPQNRENDEQIHLRFSQPPNVGVPVTLTATITDFISINTIQVSVELPTEVSILGGLPGGYAIIPSLDDPNRNTIQWMTGPITGGQGYDFAISMVVDSPFDSWIFASIEEIPQVGITSKDQETLYVRYTGSSAEVSYTSFEGFSRQDFSSIYQTGDIEATFSLFPFPTINTTTTGLLTIHNRTNQTLFYDGNITIPQAWTLTNPPSSLWSDAILPGQNGEYEFEILAGPDEGDWDVLIELTNHIGIGASGAYTHRLMYHGRFYGDNGEFYGSDYDYNLSPTPFLLNSSPYRSLTDQRALLKNQEGQFDDFIRNELLSQQQVCGQTQMTVKGDLGICQDGQVNSDCARGVAVADTLIKLFIAPDLTYMDPCTIPMYEYYTNANSNGLFVFTNIPYYKGSYFFVASGTDATSITGESYDVRSFLVDTKNPRSSTLFYHSIFVQKLLSYPGSIFDIGKKNIPFESVTENIPAIRAAPGGGFAIQTEIAGSASAFIDSHAVSPADSWDREHGKYRIHTRYPTLSRLPPTYIYASPVSHLNIPQPAEQIAIDHEYGHHTLGANGYIPTDWPSAGRQSETGEGWAEFFGLAVLNGSSEKQAPPGFSWSCLGPDSDTQRGRWRAEGTFFDLHDPIGPSGSQECFDQVDDKFSMIYHTLITTKPSNMCDVITKLRYSCGADHTMYEGAKIIWAYHGYNTEHMLPRLDLCPSPTPTPSATITPGASPTSTPGASPTPTPTPCTP